MSHPALEGPGPGPTSIPLAAIRAAITGLGIPDFDRILRITIDSEWVDVQWADPTGLQFGARYPVRSDGVECPSCHQPAGRSHTDYCPLRIREQVFAGRPYDPERDPALNLDGEPLDRTTQPATRTSQAGACSSCGRDYDMRPTATCTEPEGHDDPHPEPAAEPWVDNGCRCPDDHNHQPGCPALPPLVGDFGPHLRDACPNRGICRLHAIT